MERINRETARPIYILCTDALTACLTHLYPELPRSPSLLLSPL